MSYKFDPVSRRYVLNTEVNLSTQSNGISILTPISNDRPKSARQPSIIRVSSRSQLNGTHSLVASPASKDTVNDLTVDKMNLSMPAANDLSYLKANPTKLTSIAEEKQEVHGTNQVVSPVMTSKQQIFYNPNEGRQPLVVNGVLVRTQGTFTNPTVEQTRPVSISHYSSVSHGQSTSQNIQNNNSLNYSSVGGQQKTQQINQPIAVSQPQIISQQQQPRKYLNHSVEIPATRYETPSKPVNLNYSSEVKVKETTASQLNREMTPLSNRQTTKKLQPTFRNYVDERRAADLQQQNITLKTEVANIKNEMNSMKTKIITSQSHHRQQLEQANSKVHQLQFTISTYENMKKQIEAAIGLSHISVQEVAFRVGRLATQHKKNTEQLRQKEELLKELTIRTQQLDRNSQIQQSNSKHNEDSMKKMKEIADADRHKAADLNRKLEEHKLMLRKTRDELATCQQHLQFSEGDKDKIFELSHALEETKIQLRMAKEEMFNVNPQQLKQIHEHDKVRIIDITRQLEETKINLKRAREEASHTYELRESINKEHQAKQELNKQIDEMRKQNIRLQEQLTAKQSECKRIEQNLTSDKHQKEIYSQMIKQKDTEISTLRNQVNETTGQLSKLQRDLRALEYKQKIEKDLNECRGKVNQQMQQISRQNFTITKLEKELATCKRELKDVTDKMNSWKNDFNKTNELYGLKEKQCLKMAEKTKRLQQDLQEKMNFCQSLSNDIRNKLSEQQSKHKEEMEEIRHQLLETRANWDNRLLRQLTKFDQALKEQIEQMKIVKRKLNEREEKLMELRDKLIYADSATNGYRAELEIEKLKFMTQKKALQVHYQMQMQQLHDQLDKNNRKIEMNEQRMKRMIEEAKGKDSFIQRWVLSKPGNNEDKLQVEQFFKNYHESLNTESYQKHDEQQLKKRQQLEVANRMMSQELVRLKSLK